MCAAGAMLQLGQLGRIGVSAMAMCLLHGGQAACRLLQGPDLLALRVIHLMRRAHNTVNTPDPERISSLHWQMHLVPSIKFA